MTTHILFLSSSSLEEFPKELDGVQIIFIKNILQHRFFELVCKGFKFLFFYTFKIELQYKVKVEITPLAHILRLNHRRRILTMADERIQFEISDNLH